ADGVEAADRLEPREAVVEDAGEVGGGGAGLAGGDVVLAFQHDHAHFLPQELVRDAEPGDAAADDADIAEKVVTQGIFAAIIVRRIRPDRLGTVRHGKSSRDIVSRDYP